jgi:hypothetical protein
MAWTISSRYGTAATSATRSEPRRFWRALVHQLFSRYRPERHYMRGPGPKWREKHPAAAARRATVARMKCGPGLHPGY